jgi:hypothetical protein
MWATSKVVKLATGPHSTALADEHPVLQAVKSKLNESVKINFKKVSAKLESLFQMHPAVKPP